MTLVVAGATADIGFLVADTLLSFEYEFKDRVGIVNGQSHALKIQIIDENTAIAFAGDVSVALAMIKQILTVIVVNPAYNVPEQLFRIYRQAVEASDNEDVPDCEFLVLQLILTGKRLAHITSKGVRYCSRAYIGDAAEYAQLLKLRRPYCPPQIRQIQLADGTFRAEPLIVTDGEIEFAEISDAMERLTHQRRSTTVGAISGCVVRVVDARISGKLEYLQCAEASLRKH